MNILYIITGLSIGGAERITVDLAERMVKAGNKVSLVYLSGKKSFEISFDITVHNLEIKKTPAGFIKALSRMKHIVNVFHPDVVHANMFHAIIFSRILRLFVKIPRLICTEHSNNYHGNLRRFLEHITDFLSDVNTNVSAYATDYFIQKGVFSKKKSFTVYNGVDIKRFSKKNQNSLRHELGINEECFVFINVSRFNEAKDHKTLISAFDIVHKKYLNTCLLCVGDGELFTIINEQVIKLRLNDSVIFTGSKIDTENYYNSADCFVLSSAWEGFGLVLVEAMACELEVISTDCGGAREILQSEEFLVSVRSPDKLAAKMIEVINHSKQKRQEYGKKNRMMVKKFDLNYIANKWIDIYCDK